MLPTFKSQLGRSLQSDGSFNTSRPAAVETRNDKQAGQVVSMRDLPMRVTTDTVSAPQPRTLAWIMPFRRRVW